MDFVDDEVLPGPPRYSLRQLLLGPYDSADAHDAHFAKTFGSGDPILDSTDELRFSQATSRLVSCRVGVPERPVAHDAFVERARALPCRVALPWLRQDTHFQVVIGTSTYIDADGHELLVFRPDEGPLLERIRFGADFEMIRGEATIAGMILRHPARYLSEGWRLTPPLDDEGALGPLLATYVRLLDAEFVARMDDGDPEAREPIVTLLARAQSLPETPQRNVLVDALRSMLDLFFPGPE